MEPSILHTNNKVGLNIFYSKNVLKNVLRLVWLFHNKPSLNKNRKYVSDCVR